MLLLKHGKFGEHWGWETSFQTWGWRHLFQLDIHITPKAEDHRGFFFLLCVLGLAIEANVYDGRHSEDFDDEEPADTGAEMSWEHRLVRDSHGDLTIREVHYVDGVAQVDDDHRLVICGESVDEVREELALIALALDHPPIDVDEEDAQALADLVYQLDNERRLGEHILQPGSTLIEREVSIHGPPGIGKSAAVRGNLLTRIKRWLRGERTIDIPLNRVEDATDLRGFPEALTKRFTHIEIEPEPGERDRWNAACDKLIDELLDGTIPTYEKCGQCEGTGRTQSASNLKDEDCPVCDGMGYITRGDEA